MKLFGVVFFAAAAANAALINVTNNPSSVAGNLVCAGLGYSTTPQIIAAPASVADDAPGAENCAQQGFDEQQGYLLTQLLDVDGPAAADIAAGTTVDSHMIFLNSSTNPNAISHQGVVWTFDGLILGVISQRNGQREANSNYLGAAGTVYPGAFNARGMEAVDSYIVNGNQITVNMQVTEPGDWIRVVTAPDTITEIPEPDTYVLLGAGLLALGIARRRR